MYYIAIINEINYNININEGLSYTRGPFGYNLFLLKLKTENTVAK